LKNFAIHPRRKPAFPEFSKMMLQCRLLRASVPGSLLASAARGDASHGVYMRIIALAALAAALTLSTPAVAQNYQLNSVTATARQVFASCVSMSRKEGAANPAAACACVTGYMAGAMNDRDFEVAKTLLRVGEMTENGTSQATIEAEIMAFFERGFTEADVERVAAQVEQMSSRGDAVCGQFDNPGSV
jgi:hypothetical protein